MAKEWFSHDYGTRNKKKLAALIEEEGSRGYGLFWIIVEMLYEDSNKCMELEEFTYLAIKKESKEDIEYIREFVKKCLTVYKVFKKVKKNFFTTERVEKETKTRKEFIDKKSRAGQKSAQVRVSRSTRVEHVLKDVEQNLTPVEQNPTHNRDITGHNITREREETKAEVSPPVLSDVVTWNIEEDLLKNQLQFEKICIATRKTEAVARDSLRKYHLHLQEYEQYPKAKKALYAGFEKWLMKEKTPNQEEQNESKSTRQSFIEEHTKKILDLK